MSSATRPRLGEARQTTQTGRLSHQLPANWQKRIVARIKEVAADPYAPNNNLTKLHGRDAAYRLRVGDWRVIYELHDDRLVMVILEVGPRGGIY